MLTKAYRRLLKMRCIQRTLLFSCPVQCSWHQTVDLRIRVYAIDLSDCTCLESFHLLIRRVPDMHGPAPTFCAAPVRPQGAALVGLQGAAALGPSALLSLPRYNPVSTRYVLP